MELYNNALEIYPSEVTIKYNYINIDDIYTSTLIIMDYPQVFKNFEITDILNDLVKGQVTIFLSRQDKIELLKQLTKIIAMSKEEMITTYENRIDRDILLNKAEMARKLRNEIQVNNEEVYKLSIYITISDKDLTSLKYRQKQILNYLYTKQIIVRPANFKQKEAYITSIPLKIQDKMLEDITTKYMTTGSISNIFPFYTKSMIQNSGIIIGKHNNEVCIFDIFNSKHSNYNMCILGSSGSGKSYFVKLMILRNLYKGNKQIVFDPEGEYINIAKRFNQTVITPENCNLLYINEDFVKNNSQDYLYKKINIIIEQLKEIENFENSELNILKENILKVYFDKSITNDIKTMYLEVEKDKIYVNKKYLTGKQFPTFADLAQSIKASKNIKQTIKQKLLRCIDPLNCKVNCISESAKELIVFDISELSGSKFKLYMNIFFELLKEIKAENTLVYIDEIWKCISFGSDEKLTNKIYNMFKTLRKSNMGIISITQDIYDFFTYQDGMFGKSILNNSYNKVIFNLQYIDINEIKKMVSQKEEQLNKLKLFEKGKAFMQIGSSKFEIVVQASEWEHSIIERRNEK